MKTYIWSLPTRIFHMLFATFILLAFVTDEDNLLTYHAIIGYSIFILLVFRVVWGMIGPKHSKFSDFPFGIKRVKEFISTIFTSHKEYVGHNPAASYVMIAMLIVTFLTIVSGVLTFGIQEGKGLLSFLNNSYFKEMKVFKEIHEVLSTLLIVLIVAHLGGIVSDRVLNKKTQTLNSIITGYKVVDNEKGIKTDIYQKIIALLFFIIFITFLIFSFTNQNNTLLVSKYEPIDYKKQNELFVSECASCHTLYPSTYFA
ncbi:cytochrome b/b6 domain-containing protein [Halarcobacter ebronensis]|uniref:Cytochrome B n=1 Tax=Halarcobacter ebronensis TaxID=1462615 RepID=A0A4V1M0T9_9BACT|nr:cytochrome b/b6 domain-containing protein [Halarcobacter ebronensis]QKF83517.1 cytochrome b [Halarcobacter ebronensis]RXK08310.1 cytochrome B [Halarcobacter ebronensis]